MRGIASVVLVGNVVKEPELRAVGDTHVCNMTVAVNLPEKKQGEWTERGHFFDVKSWGKQGETAAKYLTKGSQVAITGRLEQETWSDKDTGDKRSKVVVIAENVVFIGGKQDKPKDTGEVPW